MDKWKTIELEKMKVGGNRQWNDFLEEHDDFNPGWSLEEKYNSKSAALYRDKIATEAQGQVNPKWRLFFFHYTKSGALYQKKN